MSDDVKVQKQAIPPGTVPKAINSPADARTMVVDGMTGGQVGANMVRLFFVEHISTTGETVAKHVVNLAFDSEQFAKFVDAITQMAAQMKSPGSKGA